MNGHAIPPSLCQTDLLRDSRYALLYARKLIDPGARPSRLVARPNRHFPLSPIYHDDSKK
jgi:hypothetical protein